ncbi:MAG: PQQ-dependent sugar dehydrogenase [Actinobacteria bacterium]|nr:PQQ-dependent sugar dehydrogenase [Actinomycetota bacterium]
MRVLITGVVVAGLLMGPGVVAQADDTSAEGVKLEKVGEFERPLLATAPEGDRERLFVVEKGGRVVVARGDRQSTYLNLSRKLGTAQEQGLLGLAFHPDFAKNRRFYVNYTDKAGSTRIVEYRQSRRNPNRAVRSSARSVLRVKQPESNHNGGHLVFGPDGYLYVGLGDGGGAGDPDNNGQRLDTLLGSMLRIDPVRKGRGYRIPSDNPFVNKKGARAEIFAYGLRNPWRYSFDGKKLIIADVGQGDREEVSFGTLRKLRGKNFGWNIWEGDSRYREGNAARYVAPALVRTHDEGWQSITGGHVVRDPSVPALAGRYVYGDFVKGEIRSARLAAGRASDDRDTGLNVGGLSSFGEDGRGRVYAVSLYGSVYRLTAG